MMRNELELFFDEKTWTSSTVEFYIWIMGQFFDWLEEKSIPLEDLTIRQAKNFLSERDWGNSMCRKLNSVLTQFMAWKYGQQHPLTRWKVRREQASPQRTMTQDQVEMLLASFQPDISNGYDNKQRAFAQCDTSHPLGIRNRAMVMLMLDTGLRSAEICNLELKRVDIKQQSLVAKVKFGYWREAIFSKRTASAVHTWMAVRHAFKGKSDKLFVGVMNGYQGRPISTNALGKVVRKLGLLTGIGPLSPHDFRRTFATLSIRNGASIQAVKEAGGWHSAEMVMHYTRSIRAEEVRPFLPGENLNKTAPV